MSAIYQKLYAYLVGQVDDVLQTIAKDLTEQNCGWKEMNDIGSRLKGALLEAEEMYLDSEETE